MLDGINDSLQHAKALIRLLEGTPSKVNLIPFNPFPGTHYRASPPERVEVFRQRLKRSGIISMTRKTRGDEIDAACGQLVGKVRDRSRRELRRTRSDLPGCASQGQVSNDGDTTGDLGVEQRDSPAAIYVEMGIAYLRDNQPAIALKKLKKAISVDPQNAEAHNVIAILYERLGNIGLAGEHYEKAVTLQPQNPYIRNARGSFFCKQGFYEKAGREFDDALTNPLYPTPWVAMANAGLCAELSGNMVEAETYYRKALSSNDKYPQALYQMAKLSLAQKNYLSARAYLERYNSVARATAASLWLGVQIERSLGDPIRMRDYSTQVIEEFPDAPEVQMLRRSGR